MDQLSDAAVKSSKMRSDKRSLDSACGVLDKYNETSEACWGQKPGWVEFKRD